MKKKKKFNWNWITPLIVVIIIILVIIAGIYVIITYFPNLFNINIINKNTKEILENPDILNSDCSLDLSPNEITSGDLVTGVIIDGKNTYCETYAYMEGDGVWRKVWEGYTDENGRVTDSENIFIEGTFHFRTVCDTNNNGIFDELDCITNEEILIVNPETIIPPDYNNGDVVGGDSGSTTISGGSATIEIDLGDLPPTSELGDCELKAQISTDWDYVDQESCTGLMGSEGLEFNFLDSERVVWSRTDTVPIGVGSETYCGLVWDGVNNWQLQADTLLGLPECEINLEYDINVIICDC